MDEAELVKFNDVSAEFINLSLYDTVLNLNQEEGGGIEHQGSMPFFCHNKSIF